MTFSIDAAAFVAFMLALVRAGAWVAVAPPFNHPSIPIPVKSGLAAGLALAVVPSLSHQVANTSFDTPTLLGAVAVQALAGLAFGFLIRILLSVVQAAGAMIDLFGGFMISVAYDPMTGGQAGVLGRFYDLLTVTLLFAIGGHLLLIRGFLTSFTAVPLRAPALNAIASTALGDVTTYMAAALEVAAPLVAALFLAQVVMGVISRAAPAMNVLQLSFPFTILITLMLIGLVIPQLPNTVSSLVDQALRSMASIAH